MLWSSLPLSLSLSAAGETTSQTDVIVEEMDFISALERLVPSVSDQELQHYKMIQAQISQRPWQPYLKKSYYYISVPTVSGGIRCVLAIGWMRNSYYLPEKDKREKLISAWNTSSWFAVPLSPFILGLTFVNSLLLYLTLWPAIILFFCNNSHRLPEESPAIIDVRPRWKSGALEMYRFHMGHVVTISNVKHGLYIETSIFGYIFTPCLVVGLVVAGKGTSDSRDKRFIKHVCHYSIAFSSSWLSPAIQSLVDTVLAILWKLHCTSSHSV